MSCEYSTTCLQNFAKALIHPNQKWKFAKPKFRENCSHFITWEKGLFNAMLYNYWRFPVLLMYAIYVLGNTLVLLKNRNPNCGDETLEITICYPYQDTGHL